MFARTPRLLLRPGFPEDAPAWQTVHAVVCATRGIMRRLENDELEGVLAHEMSHVAHKDVQVMTVASFLAIIAALLVRIAFYGELFGGGRRNNDQNALPIMLVLMVVSAVVARAEHTTLPSDTSTVTILDEPRGEGALLDLDDGSLLFLPKSSSAALAWIDLLPGGSTSLALPGGLTGTLAGARGVPGAAVLRAEDGTYAMFNAGSSAVFGVAGVSEMLTPPAAPRRPTTGIIPLQPNAWTLAGGELRGSNPTPGSIVSELAVRLRSRTLDAISPSAQFQA